MLCCTKYAGFPADANRKRLRAKLITMQQDAIVHDPGRGMGSGTGTVLQRYGTVRRSSRSSTAGGALGDRAVGRYVCSSWEEFLGGETLVHSPMEVWDGLGWFGMVICYCFAG